MHQKTYPNQSRSLTNKHTNKKKIVYEKPVEVKDIEGGTRLSDTWGERFEGWYSFRNVIKAESYPLNYKGTDLTYRFNICKNCYRFIMPPKIEFVDGLITYTNGERELGVFRFPRDEQGNFTAPLKPDKIQEATQAMTFSEEEIKKLMARKNPLTFFAYKIPQFLFDYIYLTEFNVQELGNITDRNFALEFKAEYDRYMTDKNEEIKTKISSSPNYLLILRNSLNRLWDLNEVSIATNGIIQA
jgi:hypothetical protein